MVVIVAITLPAILSVLPAPLAMTLATLRPPRKCYWFVGLLRFSSAAIFESPLRAGAAVGEPPLGGAAASEPPPSGAAIIESPPHGGLHWPFVDAALYAEGHCMGLLLLVS